MSAAMTDVSGMASGIQMDFTPPSGTGDIAGLASAGGVPQNPLGFLFTGIMAFVASFAFMAMGAPGWFSAIAVLSGFAFCAMYFVTKGRAEKETEERARAAYEAEERFKDEIADAVKERMKGAIKVRCGYCGSLNDEKANKCGSCGATL